MVALRRSLVLAALAGGAAAFTAPCGVPALRSERPATCGVHMVKDAADGLFTPIAKVAKSLVGHKALDKIRGNVIGQHSKVRFICFAKLTDAPVFGCIRR